MMSMHNLIKYSDNYLKPCRTLFLSCRDEADTTLTLIWVVTLKLHPPPPLKLVRVMLETSNLACRYTPIFSFRKYTF